MIFLWLLCLAALAGPRVVPAGEVRGAADVFAGKRIALIIGPSSYSDPSFPALRFTAADAASLTMALADPALGHFDRIWTLTRPEQTTRAAVLAAMKTVGDAVSSPRDTVVVYISTHGTLASDGHGGFVPYLVLSDTRLDRVGTTGLSQSAVLSWLDALPSRRRVVIFATCHSGQGKSALSEGVRADLASSKGIPVSPLRDVSEATVVIGVCAGNETAQESDVLGHDVYTYYLLDALKHGDADGDGAVTITEAHEAARTGAYAFTHGAQRAWAHADVLGEDPIVLSGTRKTAGAAVVGSYRPALDGYQVRVDGASKGELPGQIALAPGTYDLEILPPESEHVVARQRVTLHRGRREDIESLLGRDRIRTAGGLGAASLSIGPGPVIDAMGELDLPRPLGGSWELLGRGSTTLRWPDPTLSGAVVVERPLFPGSVQLRVGGGLQGWLIQDKEQRLIAPTISPVPWISATWLPQGPVWARLAATGGLLWVFEDARLKTGWSGEIALQVGLRR